MDWNSFCFNYRIEMHPRRLLGLLVRIDGYREAARNLVLPPEWRDRLNRLNRIRAVRGTTGLEGSPLSEDQVAQLLDGETGVAAETDAMAGTLDELAVRNAGAAQEWVRSRFGSGRPPLTTSDILHLHQLTTTGSDETSNVPGRFRTHDVTVGTKDLGGVHSCAPHSWVERLTGQFVAFINSRQVRDEHPVVQALLAHFFLVTIHPFGDGNGRVSRLVEAAVLHEGGYNVHGFYGLSNFFYRHGNEYKRLLQTCRQCWPANVAPFVKFGLEGFASELGGINNFIQTKLNRLVYRDMMARAADIRTGRRRRLLSQRELGLLVFLLQETEPNDPFAAEPSRQVALTELMRSPFVQHVYRHVTRRTFIRELTRLADHGFIRFEHYPESGNSTVQIDFDAIGKY